MSVPTIFQTSAVDKGLIGQYNYTPPAYFVSTTNTANQLQQPLITPYPINHIRFQMYLTVAGTTGSGTSKILSLIQNLKIYAGTASSVNIQSQIPIIWIENACLPYAGLFSALRAKSSMPIPQIMILNPTAAGNSTYYGYVDIFVNLPPGAYYITYDINSPQALAGYTGAPTSSSVAVCCIAYGEGESQTNIMGMTDYLHVGYKQNLSAFALYSTIPPGPGQLPSTGIHEVMLACVNNELSGIVSTLALDEVLPPPAIVFLEDIANYKMAGAFAAGSATGSGNNFTKALLDPAGSGNPIYVIYKTFTTPIIPNVTLTGNYTIVYATIN